MGMSFPEAFILTLFIELLILIVLLHKRYASRRIIINALAANLLTHPIVWFVFPAIGLPYTVQVASSELFAFMAEGLIYARAFQGMGSREAFLLSLLCNGASFLLGLLLQTI